MTKHGIINFLLMIKLGLAGVAYGQNDLVCSDPQTVDIASELIITRTDVLHDERALPGGPWHFSTLMEQMLPEGATDEDVGEFILDFLGSFTTATERTVNPDLPESIDNPIRRVEPRLDFHHLIVKPWLAKSRELGRTGLALDYAPFKLVAIVNRLDTRDTTQCQSSAGEGRFVFAALAAPTNSPTQTPENQSLSFTMIFEYHLPSRAESALSWARHWHELAAIDDSADFSAAVQTITHRFSSRGQLPHAPVGNPLAQIRTSEILSFPGDMREYELIAVGDSTRLRMKAPALTPDLTHNQTEALDQYFDEHITAISALTHTIPGALKGLQAPTLLRRPWQVRNLSELPEDEFDEIRFGFSKATCNGCHSMEYPRIVNIDGVYHVSPRGELSQYLIDEALPERADLLCELLNVVVCEDDSNPPFLSIPQKATRRIH